MELYIEPEKAQGAVLPRVQKTPSLMGPEMMKHVFVSAAKTLGTYLMLIVYSMLSHAQTLPSPISSTEEMLIPLPERNPARLTPLPHPSQLKTANWSAQEIQEAMDQCGMMLADTGAVYQHLEPLHEGQCGTPAPIELSAIGANPSVAITPPARVTCGLAATLSAWSDSILQRTARSQLGETITDIRNVASYVCRNRYNAPDKRISEHARANALDMAAFKTKSGKWISVLEHWALPLELRTKPPEQHVSGVTVSQPIAPPVLPTGSEPVAEGQALSREEPAEFKPESAFLYDIHTGACTLFGTVLGPLANEAHKDHFHYDLAERKHSNYCE
jgi:hypothetical protein